MRQLGLWSPKSSPVSAPVTVVEPAPAVAQAAPRVAEAGAAAYVTAVDDRRAASALADWLASELGRPVTVKLTENRSTLMSYREHDGGLRLRIHRSFRTATEAELAALADYLRGRPAERVRIAGKVLDAFFARSAPSREAPVGPTEPRGRFFDLEEIWAELNAAYFHGQSRAKITWGKAASKRYRRTIQLGCWVPEQKLIRIHPSLDQAFVPRHYVGWIIFHEMLHEVFGVEQKGGRRCVHPPEMQAIEQTHPDFARCKEWEKNHLHRLLRFRAGR
jgi:hypothetical protein